ncbi:MAG: FIG01127817: hypothetical protein [uncultured Truepera sp.]|uniref:Secreted protein n=1 Tax=uncultured Truepera sp. TaxID=543023 RepID=A0A6J4V3X3_9DEIN|nr:MAG: FIG01127817: hypothetical protein [uncultured Truepera sp.]
MKGLETEIAIIGGSLGGVAAALGALEAGARVVLTESTDWLGGQLTSQGVSAPDEHPLIERFGGTVRYNELRARVRRHYHEHYGAPATMPDGLPLNPGNGWVSRLCFEPRVGVAVIGEMLRPYAESGQLTVLYHHTPVAAAVSGRTVQNVTLRHHSGEQVEVGATFFLDATDLGDLLPLCGAPFVTGAEARADTGEPHAPLQANPAETQAMTYGFALELRPGEHHVIPKPERYEAFRDAGLYTLTLGGDETGGRRFGMFGPGDAGCLPFWSYRRLLDAQLLNVPHDVALINWSSNDYFWRSALDENAHAEAKAQALGFLYWLQTEAPRDDAHDNSGTGYPELRLRADVMDTPDGLSKAPYIREGRRLRAHRRVSETDISAAFQKGARASPFNDAVGVGWYPIDLHRCVGNPDTALFEPTRPFQVPLSSLLPLRPDNLLAAGKAMGTTHLTNGAYRLHPVEWAVGEAAGALAAHCLQEACAPLEVLQTRSQLSRFQLSLVRNGTPIAWTVDVPPEHPLFVPAQLLVVAGGIAPGSERDGRLELDLEAPLNFGERQTLSHAASGLLTDLGVPPAPPKAQTWGEACRWLLTRLY